MGTIQKFTNALQSNSARSTIEAGLDKMKSGLSAIQGWAGTAVNTASKGSTFVGMDYTKVDTIRDAIRTYVKNIQAIADYLNTDADPSKALKGEVEGAVKTYLSNMKQEMDAFISALLAYSDKMFEYAEAYRKSEQSLTSDINDAATAAASVAEQTTYTEQH